MEEYYVRSPMGGAALSQPTPQLPRDSRPAAAPTPTYTNTDLFVLALYGTVGVVGAVAWVILGQPHTGGVRAAFGAPLLLAPLGALFAQPGRRGHVVALLAGGAFIADGSWYVVLAVHAFAQGTHHPAKALEVLLRGLVLLAFFGGLPLLTRRRVPPEHILTAEVAKKARALTRPKARVLKVTARLADGRQVPAFIVNAYQIRKLPNGVTGAQVVDVAPVTK